MAEACELLLARTDRRARFNGESAPISSRIRSTASQSSLDSLNQILVVSAVAFLFDKA